MVSLRQAVSWLGVAEVRNIAMAVMLRGEVFVAPGHEPESEELWREAWLAGLWAKEIARERRKHVESAFLAALMHRTGAALALKILSRFEAEQRTVMDARTFAELVMEFEPAFGRLLMTNWNLPGDVQDAASDWRNYRDSPHSDLAGTVNAAHILATHTMYPQLLARGHRARGPGIRETGRIPRRAARDAREARSRPQPRGHMSMPPRADYDLICLGSGPAGQKAAIQAAKAGFRAAIVEREPQVGGSCLLSGTIPSKALREQALRYRRMRGEASSLAVELRATRRLSALLQGVDAVIASQDRYLQAQIARNQVELIRGKGVDARCAIGWRCSAWTGRAACCSAPRILLATGSRPRHVSSHRSGPRARARQRLDLEPAVSAANADRARQRRHRLRVRIDFAALGCAVTLVDKAAEPLGFLDPPCAQAFCAASARWAAAIAGASEVQARDSTVSRRSR